MPPTKLDTTISNNRLREAISQADTFMKRHPASNAVPVLRSLREIIDVILKERTEIRNL